MRLIAYYAHPERGRKYEREDAARILNKFQRYYVTKVDVGQSYTKVWLYGFGQEISHGFNSVFFDFYCEETKRCVDVPYELERPTVLGLFDVSELSVRRSEDTERTAASRNDTGKLHGNGYRAEVIVVDSTMSQERVNHESTNELISRADAIELCADAQGRASTKAELKGISKVWQGLRKLPSAEAVQGWIPCSKMLPKAEDCPMDCMVTRRSKYVGNYTDMAVAEADGTWTHEDWKAITIDGNATCISTRDADIIAWMPLPTPYKGGDSE